MEKTPFQKTPFQKAILIAGPTASGKSALAFAIAKKLEGVLINADSLQLFCDLKLLTAFPTSQEQECLQHKLYGVLKDLKERPDAAWWQQEAYGAIKQAQGQGKLPIVVGGTGFYLKALYEGIDRFPPISKQVREEVRTLLKNQGYEGLLKRYQEVLQGQSPQRNLPQDPQRLGRALEVLLQTGQELWSFYQNQRCDNSVEKGFDFIKILIDDDRDFLAQRARLRIEHMVAQGVVEEVRAFIDKNPPKGCPLWKAIGIQEMQDYDQGLISLEMAKEKMVTATRQYIKRQQTWFKGQYRADLVLQSHDQSVVEKALAFLCS